MIKPLNHFANEKAKYGRDGTLLAVQTAEIVRKNDKRGGSRAPARGGRGQSRRRVETIEEEDEEGQEDEDGEEDVEDWEARGEMIYGEVNGYDPLTGQTLPDVFETGMFLPLSSPFLSFTSPLSLDLRLSLSQSTNTEVK